MHTIQAHKPMNISHISSRNKTQSKETMRAHMRLCQESHSCYVYNMYICIHYNYNYVWLDNNCSLYFIIFTIPGIRSGTRQSLIIPT